MCAFKKMVFLSVLSSILQDEEKRRNSRMCDMLFIATSHRLAELIFSLDNHCRQLSDRERVDIKVQIRPELRFVKQMKHNLYFIISWWMSMNQAG